MTMEVTAIRMCLLTCIFLYIGEELILNLVLASMNPSRYYVRTR